MTDIIETLKSFAAEVDYSYRQAVTPDVVRAVLNALGHSYKAKIDWFHVNEEIVPTEVKMSVVLKSEYGVKLDQYTLPLSVFTSNDPVRAIKRLRAMLERDKLEENITSHEHELVRFKKALEQINLTIAELED